MSDPDQAMPDPEAVALLQELVGYLLRIAVISGRDTDAVAARLPVDGLVFIGNHGLEERNGESRLVAVVTPYAAALERAAEAVTRLEEARHPGVRVERKRAGVTIHFRNAADPSASQISLRPPLERIAHDEHLGLFGGRMVWELRPPLDIDKGQVLQRLAAAIHPAGIIYMGDDRTDADAFTALKAMSRTQTLAVGVRSQEVPDTTFADCDLMVDGVAGATQLLRELRDFSRLA